MGDGCEVRTGFQHLFSRSNIYIQVSNLYTVPEYRNRGIGKSLEISLAKKFVRFGSLSDCEAKLPYNNLFYSSISFPFFDNTFMNPFRQGMRVFKFVDDDTPVYNGTLKSPLWTLWKSEDGEPNYSYFRKFVRD